MISYRSFHDLIPILVQFIYIKQENWQTIYTHILFVNFPIPILVQFIYIYKTRKLTNNIYIYIVCQFSHTNFSAVYIYKTRKLTNNIYILFVNFLIPILVQFIYIKQENWQTIYIVCQFSHTNFSAVYIYKTRKLTNNIYIYFLSIFLYFWNAVSHFKRKEEKKWRSGTYHHVGYSLL